MTLSEERLKQFLTIAFQLLKDHDEQIGELRASAAATAAFLEQTAPGFLAWRDREAARIRVRDADAARRDSDAIQRLLQLIQS
jgi:hypothetical protein